MGHIVYFQQYAHQPIIFRTGGNPGFHEAIGDSIALAVNTPKHLSEVGLLPGFDSSQETAASDINYLMQQARVVKLARNCEYSFKNKLC